MVIWRGGRGKGVKFTGSSLFSVGEDEIQRNNQEIRKSGKERAECGLSTTEGIAVAHSLMKKECGRMDIRSWPFSPVPTGFVTSPMGAPQFIY
jgi:hypothetical protein